MEKPGYRSIDVRVFCYTTSYIETMICSDLYRDEQKQEW